MRLSQLIPKYLGFLKIQQNLAERTLVNYRHYLNRFRDFAGDISVQEITPELVQSYKSYLARYLDPLTQLPLKRNTQNYHLIALRNFLAYLQQQQIPTLAKEQISLQPLTNTRFQVLTKEEIERLLAAVEPKDEQGLRDRAILGLLVNTGLLVSELINLERSQIDLVKGCIKFYDKNQKTKVVGLNDTVKSWIESYLHTRQDASPALFVRVKSKGQMKERLTARSIERIVTRYGERARLTQQVTPLILRHTFAVNLLAAGKSLDELQQILGHTHPTSTKRYVHFLMQTTF